MYTRTFMKVHHAKNRLECNIRYLDIYLSLVIYS